MIVPVCLGILLVGIVMVPTVYGFEYDFYDGFYITYGNCDLNVEANMEWVEVNLMELYNDPDYDFGSILTAWCSMIENKEYEYVATLDNAIVIDVTNVSDRNYYTQWELPTTGHPAEGWLQILPKNWDEGDSIIYGDGMPYLEYKGIESKIINGKSIEVYVFEGTASKDLVEGTCITCGTGVITSTITYTYDSKTGMMISISKSSHMIAINDGLGVTAGFPTEEYEAVTVTTTSIDPIDISDEPEYHVMSKEQIDEAMAGLEEHKQQTGTGCGTGTVLVDGVCQLAPQESNDGCGAGTVMVNGVCQLANTGSPFNILSISTIEPLYIVIGAVAVGAAIIGIVFAVKRGSSGTSTPKPARQDVEDYEEQYLRRQGQRPSRKPAETRQTSAFCDSCGAKLKPEAKFCGKCGNSISR